jgi:hypothetical protein
VIGRLERRVHVAARTLVREDQIARQLRPGQRRARLERRRRVGDSRQRVVVDFDLGRGIFGERGRLRGDRGQRRADRVYRAAGQDRVGRRRHLARTLVQRHLGHAGQIVGREHGEDARHSAGPLNVETCDARVGVRTARKGHVDHPRQRQIVDESAAPGEQSGVFPAAHWPPDKAVRRRHVRLRA